MKEPTQFITNEKGERIAVIVSIEDYEEMIETIEDLLDIRAIDEAKASGEVPIPFEQAMAENRRNRK
jgi:hypothetical protein